LKIAVAVKQFKPGATRLVAGKAVLNGLLTRIPDSEFTAIQPHLEFAVFNLGEYLERAGRPITAAYFPNRGICSLLIETPDARSVEVGLAGCEEIIGLTLIGGVDQLPYSVFVQVPGEGFRIMSGAMKRIFAFMPEFTRMLVRRLSIHAVEDSQNTACNRLHSLEQRLAKLLLMVHDRLDTDDINITHDFLSKMIGADRTSVSLAIGEFENRGMLARRRGFVNIKSRQMLEKESCECYQVFKAFNSELGLRT
jgi:CRP-like cAMP-binding protein